MHQGHSITLQEIDFSVATIVVTESHKVAIIGF
ncbi:hypothetical protein MTR67_007257 [Solanum verrucosum]|uniref:Uncharacterized protein n=1 Tax=Solanum verrucosum TaxID=315347 RepID=A0AAF0PZI3_SOLVR|nr:hypothetical protein MTR67_007257 [Solanum verrucosum]